MKYFTIILMLIGIFTDIGNCYTVRRNGTRAKISGGSYIDIKDAPFHVAIIYNGKYLCGGALLSLEHVLTAAHCVREKINNPEKPLQVQAGTHNRENNPITINVVDFIIHPKYLIIPDSDLSVLKLATPLPYSDRIDVIFLPRSPARIGEKVRLTGFGWYSSNIPTACNVLKRLETHIVDCKTALPEQKNYFTDVHLCTSNIVGTGSCKGDSGGPLVNMQRELVGVQIRSYGTAKNGFGGHGFPDIFADIFYFKEFIKKAMKVLK